VLIRGDRQALRPDGGGDQNCGGFVQMNRVYVLGTGASRDLKFRISTIDAGYGTYQYKDCDLQGPLSSGYFYYVQQISKQIQANSGLCVPSKAADSLLKYISDGYGVSSDDLLENENISWQVNIEELYLRIESEIEQFDREDKSKEELALLENKDYIGLNMRQWELMEYIVGSLSFIGYHCFSKNHAVFANHVVNNGGDVISFNWDILFDEAMVYTDQWDCQSGYGLKFQKVLSKSGDAITQMNQSRNLILKPHGSINWYHKSLFDDGHLYVLLQVKRRLRGGTIGYLRNAEKIGEDLFRSYIVPPGKKRKYFPEVWQKIKEVLENADEIVAMGFSFNQNDPHVREEFSGLSFKKDLSVRIVNPSSGQLIQTYKEVFKTSNVEKIANSFDEFCQSLNKFLVSNSTNA
jgi:hypothetical protein